MILTEKAKEILSVEKNKIHLCHLIGVSYATVHRWLRDDSEKLTMARVIEAIVEVTGIDKDDLFEVEITHYSVHNN